MLKAGEILILTGTPGSGKTTVAASLAASPGVPKVHLHSDDFWHVIKSGAIDPWLPEAHDQNRVVIEALAATARIYAQGGYFVIVDGIIGPWFLPAFRALGMPLHYIVLRPSLSQAISRCQQRGGDTLRDPGTITELHRQFAELGDLSNHQLQTDGMSAAAVQTAVLDAVGREICRLR
ncbi:AAA family ATPase [Paracoccus caeni]|uniref:AAA family ATPase n=1 Tax=Paracoccus caeni TaxID=657651 RepID=A0A934SFF2_9RHOB|nr:AAA family ATPase [Paracoccus caeni]MBK4215996.1 AAA family ATPase [Paracoccus caeni]